MSLQIAKVKNIPIKLHFTLIIVFLLLAWTASSNFMPTYFPNLSVIQYWIMGIISAVVLFISVLLHELAHSLQSLKYGLKVRQIILFIFGGIADIKEETKDYHKEFRIAVVGPLTSIGLSAGFLIAWLVLLQITGSAALPVIPISQNITNGEESVMVNQGRDVIENENVVDINNVGNEFLFIRAISGILLYSTIVNALISIFNLLPAFPLDGGRMLRAGLMKWNKSYGEATRISVRIGIGISYVIMAFGFITIFTGSFVGGIWLIIIGWFLQTGAQAYLQQQEISSVLSHVRLKAIMNPRFTSVNMSQTADEVLINPFNKYRKSEFPVVNEDGYLVGSISAKQIMNVSEDQLKNVRVNDIMTPLEELIVMDPTAKADEALKRLLSKNKSRIFVCNSQIQPPNPAENEYQEPGTNKIDLRKTKRELLGIVSKSDLLNVAAEQEEYEKSINDSNIKR